MESADNEGTEGRDGHGRVPISGNLVKGGVEVLDNLRSLVSTHNGRLQLGTTLEAYKRRFGTLPFNQMEDLEYMVTILRDLTLKRLITQEHHLDESSSSCAEKDLYEARLQKKLHVFSQRCIYVLGNFPGGETCINNFAYEYNIVFGLQGWRRDAKAVGFYTLTDTLNAIPETVTVEKENFATTFVRLTNTAKSKLCLVDLEEYPNQHASSKEIKDKSISAVGYSPHKFRGHSQACTLKRTAMPLAKKYKL